MSKRGAEAAELDPPPKRFREETTDVDPVRDESIFAQLLGMLQSGFQFFFGHRKRAMPMLPAPAVLQSEAQALPTPVLPEDLAQQKLAGPLIAFPQLDKLPVEVSLPNEEVPYEQLRSELEAPFQVMLNFLSNRDLANLGIACRQMRDWTSEEREKRAASALVLATEQGDEIKARRLLEINRSLLCSPIEGFTAFQTALRAGDVEMCEMMKGHFVQLEDGQAQMEKQFNAIFPNGMEAHAEDQKAKVFNFDEIVQAIIAAPDAEVTSALHKAFDDKRPLHLALKEFREAFSAKSLSEIVFNPYHLLRAFERYDAEFDNFGNWDKRDLFWRQVIGFVQLHLTACYRQAFAQGIYYILEAKEPLRRSFQFRFEPATSMAPGVGLEGLGFDWAGGELAGVLVAFGGCSPVRPAARSLVGLSCWLEILCRAKTSSLEKLLSPVQRHSRELGV